MPVGFLYVKDGRPVHKGEILSVILPSTTFTAPISIILFFLGLKPVVSISNTTKVSPKSWPWNSLPSTSCLYQVHWVSLHPVEGF